MMSFQSSQEMMILRIMCKLTGTGSSKIRDTAELTWIKDTLEDLERNSIENTEDASSFLRAVAFMSEYLLESSDIEERRNGLKTR